MDLYLVSGFLGSGKTTLIIRLSKFLMEKGKKIAVVTNDQGKYLVDTAFVNAENIPAVDVQSGCYCTNYPDLLRQLEYLQKKIDPDIVFAEAIGSSANLSGTVGAALLQTNDFRAKALITLADARLMLRRVKGEPLPFSENVKAVYDSQINESDCLIINKIDLLTKADISVLQQEIPRHFSTDNSRFISAFCRRDLQELFEHLSRIRSSALRNAAPDPQLKSEAFRNLKWYEQQFELEDPNDVHDALLTRLKDMLNSFEKQAFRIIRFKCLVRTREQNHYSFDISPSDPLSWKILLRDLHSTKASVLINARLLRETALR
ncbi:MAG: GTP-binding protein [Candidatus Marinimicrobia bacterium]|nr:GTP-binding protein [Candidatus Neomarinimicrobiota bacterium]MDD4961204.1 GTP-binding protein [Candidatus Neomarinimicrobiota bacterium]